MQTETGERDAITATLCTARPDMYSMQKLYEGADNGITPARLRDLQCAAVKRGFTTEWVDLRSGVEAVPVPAGCGKPGWPEANAFILRDAVGMFLDMDAKEARELVYQELTGIKYDTKRWMTRQNKALNAHARYTSVVADCERESTMELDGRGVINHFRDTPTFDKLRHAISSFLGRETPLISEINRYSDVKTAGIGWHGDAERALWSLVRLGPGTDKMPLMFQWFYMFNPYGNIMRMDLEWGDVCFFTNKATGFDFGKPSLLALRHAAGSATCSYVKPKPTADQRAAAKRARDDRRDDRNEEKKYKAELFSRFPADEARYQYNLHKVVKKLRGGK